VEVVAVVPAVELVEPVDIELLDMAQVHYDLLLYL
tara:strand:+ start:90 stop:194 length:105 start_codon:yes stop_codon:yes gene_type:complete